MQLKNFRKIEFSMNEKAVFAEMLFNDVHVNCQIYCGASANILPYKYVEKEKISSCDRALVMWDSTEVKSMWTCVERVISLRDQREYNVNFLIAKMT